MIELRPYQHEAVAAVYGHLRQRDDNPCLVLPTASGKILDQLAVPAEARTFAALGRDDVLAPGTALPKPKGVFPRYVQAEAAQER